VIEGVHGDLQHAHVSVDAGDRDFFDLVLFEKCGKLIGNPSIARSRKGKSRIGEWADFVSKIDFGRFAAFVPVKEAAVGASFGVDKPSEQDGLETAALDQVSDSGRNVAGKVIDESFLDINH